MTGYLPSVAEAMAAAARRAPAMMRGEDRDERALTEEVAALLGKKAALFVPTCTMANQIALRLWCPPGSAVLAERRAHVATIERGATALTGAAVQAEAGDHGHLQPDTVKRAVKAGGPLPSLVWLENTSMRAGGTIMPEGWQTAISTGLHGTGIKLHLDGSRLWNAAVGSGQSMAELADGADTVAVSLNKAVGAPLGSILAGSSESITRATVLCEQLGGHWRPTGILAAAARSALRDSSHRISAAHEAAAKLARILRASLGSRVSEPQTNIILIDSPGTADQIVLSLHRRNALVLALNADTIRLVMHAGILRADSKLLASAIIAAYSP